MCPIISVDFDEVEDSNKNIDLSASGGYQWSVEERKKVLDAFRIHQTDFASVSRYVASKTEAQCRNYYHNFKRKFGISAGKWLKLSRLSQDQYLQKVVAVVGREKGSMEESIKNADKDTDNRIVPINEIVKAKDATEQRKPVRYSVKDVEPQQKIKPKKPAIPDSLIALGVVRGRAAAKRAELAIKEQSALTPRSAPEKFVRSSSLGLTSSPKLMA